MRIYLNFLFILKKPLIFSFPFTKDSQKTTSFFLSKKHTGLGTSPQAAGWESPCLLYISDLPESPKAKGQGIPEEIFTSSDRCKAKKKPSLIQTSIFPEAKKKWNIFLTYVKGHLKQNQLNHPTLFSFSNSSSTRGANTNASITAPWAPGSAARPRRWRRWRRCRDCCGCRGGARRARRRAGWDASSLTLGAVGDSCFFFLEFLRSLTYWEQFAVGFWIFLVFFLAVGSKLFGALKGIEKSVGCLHLLSWGGAAFSVAMRMGGEWLLA